VKKKLILILLLVELPLAHAQIPWKLEPFMEYFGHVRDSGLGFTVRGFMGSHSNNPYNVAIGGQPRSLDLDLRFYSISSPTDTTPRWVIPYGRNLEHGDFNHDGWTDFAVHKVTAGTQYDTVMIYFGHATGIDTVASLKLAAEQEFSGFGTFMRRGDVNNDGIDDLIITSRFTTQMNEANRGKVYIYHGSNSLPATPAFTITGDHGGAGLSGRCVIADFNDDGFKDLAVGGRHIVGTSDVHFNYLNLYFGSAAGFDTVADLTGPKSYRTIVNGLAAFDVNADGKTDLLWAFLDSLTSLQSVFIYYGGSDFAERFHVGPDFVIPPPFGSGEFGNEIINAGDMNGDGDDDIAIAAYSTAQGNGIVFVYTAGKALDDKYDAARGQSREGNFGFSVDRVGDINNDGYGDIIVGAPLQPWSRYQGYFGIFLGDSRILTSVAVRLTENLPSAFELSSASPNPFRFHTRIAFGLPRPAFVEITIFDVLGKEVKTLLEAEYIAGQYQVSWDGKGRNRENVPSGIHFVRMRVLAAERSSLLFEQTQKIAFIK